MAKIQYKSFKFKEPTLKLIGLCDGILKKYAAAGYDMTLRQLYYQPVSADLIANKQTEYDRLGSIINDAAAFSDADRLEVEAAIDRSHAEDCDGCEGCDPDNETGWHEDDED